MSEAEGCSDGERCEEIPEREARGIMVAEVCSDEGVYSDGDIRLRPSISGG